MTAPAVAMPDPITVQLKRLPHGVGLPMPLRATAGAAGFDVAAAVGDDAPVTIEPGGIARVPLGFALAVPGGHECQVRARSGLASRFGVVPVNAPGTVDADYRGEVFVPLVNLGREAFTVRRGDRVAQVLIVPVPAATFVEVESLDETARGDRGFGSTGGGS